MRFDPCDCIKNVAAIMLGWSPMHGRTQLVHCRTAEQSAGSTNTLSFETSQHRCPDACVITSICLVLARGGEQVKAGLHRATAGKVQCMQLGKLMQFDRKTAPVAAEAAAGMPVNSTNINTKLVHGRGLQHFGNALSACVCACHFCCSPS